MKTILVPVDLSSATKNVCEAACRLAKSLEGRVVLLHVVQPPPIMMNEVYAFEASQTEVLVTEAKKRSAPRLRALAQACEKRGVPTRTVQTVGFPVQEILSQARRADYLVMGTHGHTAFYELLAGSTTHGVLKKSPCPVVVIPPTIRNKR